MPDMPGLAMPPMGPSDPASMPTQDAGAAAAAMAQVRTAVQLLQEALPALPIGSPPHKDVLDAVSKLSKSVPPSNEVPGVQMTQLQQLGQKAQGDQMLQQLAAAMGQGQNVPPVQPMQ